MYLVQTRNTVYLPLKVELRKTLTVFEDTGGRSPILPHIILFFLGLGSSSTISVSPGSDIVTSDPFVADNFLTLPLRFSFRIL